MIIASGNLAWSIPGVRADDLAFSYAKLIDSVPGVSQAKGQIVAGTLVLSTLIEPDKEVEKAVHEAELSMWERYDDAPLRFVVYRDTDAFEQDTADAEALFRR
jgi:hypothetical protein